MTSTRKYDEVMGHIVATPEMRERVLLNVRVACAEGGFGTGKLLRFSSRRLKAVAVVAVCCVLALGCVSVYQLGANSTSGPSSESPIVAGDTQTDDDDDLGQTYVEPFVELESAEALAAKVGFEVEELSDLPFEVEEIYYTAYEGEMAEITYNGEGETATIRKAAGADDVSGDYNSYDNTAEIELGGNAVTLKGDKKGYVLAIWHDGEYSYAVSLTTELSQDEWQALLVRSTTSPAS